MGPSFGDMFGMTFVIMAVVGVITLASFAFVGFFVYRLFAQGAKNRAILQTGLPAYAVVLQLADTGTRVNDNPQVQIVLEVRPHDRPPFQAVATTIVPIIARPRVQPGQTVTVRYNPQNPQEVALEM